MERCICCGIAAQQHPFVGVGRANLDNNAGDMSAHPVCELCFKNPEHRTLNPNPKVHFFPRASAPIAVNAAKRTDEDSRSGRDIGLGMGTV